MAGGLCLRGWRKNSFGGRFVFARDKEKFRRTGKVHFFHNGMLTIAVVRSGSHERMPSNPNNA